MRKPVEDLAAEYVLLKKEDPHHWVKNRSWDIYQEMCRRVGAEHTTTHIKRAEEIYDLLTPKEK